MGDTLPLHPGTITFVDADTGTEEQKAFNQVPAHLAYVQLKDRCVPVTRVIKSSQGQEISIRTFGPDGEFLQVTLGRVNPV